MSEAGEIKLPHDNDLSVTRPSTQFKNWSISVLAQPSINTGIKEAAWRRGERTVDNVSDLNPLFLGLGRNTGTRSSLLDLLCLPKPCLSQSWSFPLDLLSQKTECPTNTASTSPGLQLVPAGTGSFISATSSSKGSQIYWSPAWSACGHSVDTPLELMLWRSILWVFAWPS